jgi:hypothetical protein
MSWKLAIFALAATAALLAGCVTHTAAASVESKAYIADGSIFGTTMYNCEVNNGQPECWPVIEQESAQ